MARVLKMSSRNKNFTQVDLRRELLTQVEIFLTYVEALRRNFFSKFLRSAKTLASTSLGRTIRRMAKAPRQSSPEKTELTALSVSPAWTRPRNLEKLKATCAERAV